MSPDCASLVPDGSRPPDGQLPLIRYSHIFSSAVREFLEIKLLHEASEGSVTPRQLQLLRFVEVAHHHIDEVAKFLEITGPAATKAIDKLESGGFIVRTPSGDDRRVKFLSCSDKGKRLVARYRALEQERLGAILTQFTADETTALARLLERYSLALIATETADSEACLRCAGYFDADCAVQFVQSNCPYRHRAEEEQ